MRTNHVCSHSMPPEPCSLFSDGAFAEPQVLQMFLCGRPPITAVSSAFQDLRILRNKKALAIAPQWYQYRRTSHDLLAWLEEIQRTVDQLPDPPEGGRVKVKHGSLSCFGFVLHDAFMCHPSGTGWFLYFSCFTAFDESCSGVSGTKVVAGFDHQISSTAFFNIHLQPSLTKEIKK